MVDSDLEYVAAREECRAGPLFLRGPHTARRCAGSGLVSRRFYGCNGVPDNVVRQAFRVGWVSRGWTGRGDDSEQQRRAHGEDHQISPGSVLPPPVHPSQAHVGCPVTARRKSDADTGGGPQLNLRTPALPVERRRRDGLGLLPPAMTPQQQRQRARANRLAAAALIVVGAFVVGGSLSLLVQRSEPVVWLGLIFGGVVVVQGVLLAGRRERRGTGRPKRPEQF